MIDPTQDITHTRGDTFKRSFEFTDSTGAAIDLTGSTIVFSIKKDLSTTPALVTGTLTLDDPTHGKASISIPAATMKTLVDLGTFYYDFQWTDSVGTVKTIPKGKFYNTFDVT